MALFEAPQIDQTDQTNETDEAPEDEAWLDEADEADTTSPVAYSVPDIEGFALALEDRPVKRAKVPAKKELAWEEFLDFLKQKPGTTARVFMFVGDEASTKARSRARSMRSRMVKTQPGDLWNITAEEIKEDGSWKVFASYDGPASDEVVAERHRIHAERVARGHAIAEARFAK